MKSAAKSKRLIWVEWMVLIGVLFVFPPAAVAHPLDEYYQVTYISVVPNRITLQIELYPGILIAPRILALLDTDQDDRLSEAESRAYINLFLTDITFEIDGQSTSLTLAQHGLFAVKGRKPTTRKGKYDTMTRMN